MQPNVYRAGSLFGDDDAPTVPEGGEMSRRITLAGAMVSAVALIAVAAVPASARVPGGQGLASFGFPTCDHGLGVVELFGPPAGPAASGYLIVDEETSLHAIARRFELTAGGEVVFEKNFGKKAGLSTITCTETLEDPEETTVFTLTAAIVPPR
jgi:hypothetical protein